MARVALVARIMDALFVIPGTGIRLGFDAILGLVPVAGDLIAQAIATSSSGRRTGSEWARSRSCACSATR